MVNPGGDAGVTAAPGDSSLQPLLVGVHARSTATTIPPGNRNENAAPKQQQQHPRAVNYRFVGGINTWLDRLTLAIALIAWFSVGILAIVTSKVLIGDWGCPPLILTVQQMVVGTTILRLVVAARDGAAQPLPWEHFSVPSAKSTALLSDKLKRLLPWLSHMNFILVGCFNSLDFLCSNYAFSQSAAHFVETIKASDPITTTAVALIYRVDTLGAAEGASLVLLVTGVLLSTWGNAKNNETDDVSTAEAVAPELWDSVRTMAMVMMANICFAFRAMNQKRYRVTTNELQQLDDANLFCRMCQIGATFLALPLILLHWKDFIVAWNQPFDLQRTYFGLVLINSFSYVTYKLSRMAIIVGPLICSITHLFLLFGSSVMVHQTTIFDSLASTYILSKLTVLHHSSLNCLRRMVAILATSLFFHKPMSFEARAGLMTSFFGFSSFTYHRAHRNRVVPAVKTKDSNV